MIFTNMEAILKVDASISDGYEYKHIFGTSKTPSAYFECIIFGKINICNTCAV